MESRWRLNMFSQKLNKKQYKNSDGFGKLSMGNEMGNNNTSAIKEEDNISEAEKNTFQEDTSELAKGVSQDIHAGSDKEENHNIPTSIARNVMEKASNDITNELGKDTCQEDGHSEYVKGKTQTIATDEAKDDDTQEKAIWSASNHTTGMLENDSTEGDTRADDVNMENQFLPTTEAEGVQDKATGLVSEDATTELGKVTLQEDSHAGHENMENQMLPTAEAEGVQEKAAGVVSEDATTELGQVTLQEDSHADDVKEKMKMIPTDEAESVQDKASGDVSEDATAEIGKVTLQENSHADDVKEKVEMVPTDEAKDVQEEATGINPNNAASVFENALLGEDTSKTDMNVENMHPTFDVEDVQEKATGMASDCTRISLENGLLKEDAHEDDSNVDHQKHQTVEGKDDHIAARLDFDDTTGEFEDKLQEDKQDGNVVIPISIGIDVEGKTTISASDDLLNLTNSFEDAGNGITEVRQPEKSPSAGLVEAEDGNPESLSGSSLEGNEEYEKQEESCLIEHQLVTYSHRLNHEPSIQHGDETTEVSQTEKSPNAGPVEAEDGDSENLSSSTLEGILEYEKLEESCLTEPISVTYNHHLIKEPSIQHADEEETTILMMNDVNMSNNIQIQESSSVHSDNDEPVKFLSVQSFLGTKSPLDENLIDTNSHSQQTKDGGQEKAMESHEKLDGKNVNEFGNNSSETISDSLSIDNKTNGNSLSKVNYATEDSLNSHIESFLEDNPLKFDHEENCKVLYEESTLRRSRSTNENSHDYKPGQCMKDSLEEYKYGMVYTCDMAIGSNGDCNGEKKTLHGSIVSRLVTKDPVEEPEVTENGVLFDAYASNSNKASEERGAAASGEKHSVVPEAKRISLIPGLTVVDCRHEEGENRKNKIEETNEKPEASHVKVNTFEETEILGQCNSDLVTINQEESFPMQNVSSLLHICDCHQDNVNQSKSLTAISKSDWKQTNESKTFGSNLDSSMLTVPPVDLVGNESLEEEGEEYLQHTEEASSEGAELTTSTATKSIEPCSNNYIFANGGCETRDSVSRLSTESNPDHPNIIQKSPSFNLNLRKEARPEELSDQTPLLPQDKSANKSLSKQTSLNLTKSMPHDEYEQCMLHSEEMPVEEKIVTMERSYSRKSKAPFICLLREEEEAHLLDRPQIQDNHVGTKNAVSSATSHKRKEKRKPRSPFFSSCMCCATVP
ncbi:hypothetical protein Fmac_028138 [Flemingia macrophylla]|uniref:Uncharacterized protein n=1 Tax=Flemingia macrophylla TaxID=520843 RepID=A0ABD1LJQ1_9FABA